MLALDYALAGLGLGAIAALSGVGLLITYRTTGVFNIAHGAIAMVAAYLFWQLNSRWGVPVGAAALIVIGVVAPAFGIVLERVEFPVAVRRAIRQRDDVAVREGEGALGERHQHQAPEEHAAGAEARGRP